MILGTTRLEVVDFPIQNLGRKEIFRTRLCQFGVVKYFHQDSWISEIYHGKVKVTKVALTKSERHEVW